MSKHLRILEVIGVVSALAYTLLLANITATNESIVGVVEFLQGRIYGFALLSSLIYLFICFVKRLYAESLLQVFYVATGIYGWMYFNETGGEISGNLPWMWHALVILSGTALFLISGYLLSKMTDAATPYVDSFTTVFSIFATMLMINLVPENWWYWIVIDAVSVWLYLQRKLYLTAGLFFLYTILAVYGVYSW